MEETMRFSTFRKRMPNVTMSRSACSLISCASSRRGLVSRTAYAEVPPRVEYRLTEIGRTLEPVIDALKRWSEEHSPVEKVAEAA